MNNENKSIVRQVTLKQPMDFEDGKRPTISLALTVKPGEIECFKSRDDAMALLNTVGPYVDEIVVVMVDPTALALRLIKEHPIFQVTPHSLIEINPTKNPELYLLDVSETYAVGSPLAGEVYQGPYTGAHVVADWANLRNLGLSRCSQEWRLVLSGNDVLINPAYLAGVCEAMAGVGSDLGYSKYIHPVADVPTYKLASTLTGRIVRSGAPVQFEGVALESLEGSTMIAILDGSLVTLKASRSNLVNDSANGFKALYANARKQDWDIPPCNLLHMAKTARYVDMTDFAEAAIAAYLKVSLYTEERSWACALQGEILEQRRDYAGASGWYERAIAEHPGSKSAYRLCRTRFFESNWQAVVDAYQVGVDNDAFVHLVDDGVDNRNDCLILVTVALEKLGRSTEAKENCRLLRELFPQSPHVLELCDRLCP